MIKVNPEGGINDLTKFYGDSCRDIPLKTTNFSLTVALEDKSRDHRSHYDSSPRDHECLYKTDWKSIQYLLRYISVHQNDIAIPRVTMGKNHESISA